VKDRPRSRRSRRSRQTVELLKKAGIWIFLACFVASIVGVALVTIGR
jgi:hypothetical protein